MPPLTDASEKPARLHQLRRQIRELEGYRPQSGEAASQLHPLPLGLAAIDGLLPEGGLTPGAIHEFTGPAAPALALLFARQHTSSETSRPAPLLWVRDNSQNHRLNPLALTRFALDPGLLTLVDASGEKALWAAEEALKSASLPLVILELARPLSLRDSRRLQLAASEGGSTGLILRPKDPHGAIANAAERSYWHAAPAPTPAALPAETTPSAALSNWHIDLMRNRNGKTANWTITWDEKAHLVALSAAPCRQQARPQGTSAVA